MGDLRTWSDKYIIYGSISQITHRNPFISRTRSAKKTPLEYQRHVQMDLLTYNDTQQYNIRPS